MQEGKWNQAGLEGERGVTGATISTYMELAKFKAPHLLRYLTSALLLSKRRVVKSASGSQHEVRSLMKNLVRIMQHCDYTNPIVEFVDCLCVKFDLEEAHGKLTECEAVLATGFFLCNQTALFMGEARVFVFDNRVGFVTRLI